MVEEKAQWAFAVAPRSKTWLTVVVWPGESEKRERKSSGTVCSRSEPRIVWRKRRLGSGGEQCGLSPIPFPHAPRTNTPARTKWRNFIDPTTTVLFPANIGHTHPYGESEVLHIPPNLQLSSPLLLSPSTPTWLLLLRGMPRNHSFLSSHSLCQCSAAPPVPTSTSSPPDSPM